MNQYIIQQSGKMKKKVIALLQARTDSSRLPKKVLKSILGKPMIIHQLKRTIKSNYIDEVLLLTSDEDSDELLSTTVIENGFKVYRGDKNNVLKRFYDSVSNLKLNDDDVIVRLTGDCPLHDSVVIDESITAFLNSDCDYLTNSIEAVYPDGLDVEVFNYKALKEAFFNASQKSELEHVTPYIRNSGKFKIENLKKTPCYPEWRLTVDEPNDFILINKIFEHFNSTYFSFEEIVKYLEKNRELLTINSKITRNEGYEKSLKEDKDDN